MTSVSRDRSRDTRLLSVPDAAQTLGCSRTHIYGLIAAGHLRAVEIKATGTRPKTRIRSDDLQTFIEDRTREVPA